MRTIRAICETIHLGVLGLWAGSVLMIGVVAAIGFPTMKALRPTLPEYAAYPADEHWIIAAGAVMNKGFLASDWIGIGCAVLAVVTLLVVLLGARVRFARPATILRTLALAGAVGVLIYSVGVLRPRMQEALHSFWEAAKVGDLARAEPQREAFDAMHPTASRLIGAQLVLVLCALGFGGYAATTDRARRRDGVDGGGSS